ncbi:hypothetical protein [Salmonirosea aquatica]|uniref:hypothetical protein n=1 Tax=Salmonirosea aquatica TaxID=2654236 RepID=UPI0040328D02
MPVSGFFEWHTQGKKKYPFYIRPTTGNREHCGPVGRVGDPALGRCITTHADPAHQRADGKIHNSKKRMRAADQEQEREYLKSLTAERGFGIIGRSYAASALEAYSVNKLITSRTNRPTYRPCWNRYLPGIAICYKTSSILSDLQLNAQRVVGHFDLRSWRISQERSKPMAPPSRVAPMRWLSRSSTAIACGRPPDALVHGEQVGLDVVLVHDGLTRIPAFL